VQFLLLQYLPLVYIPLAQLLKLTGSTTTITKAMIKDSKNCIKQFGYLDVGYSQAIAMHMVTRVTGLHL